MWVGFVTFRFDGRAVVVAGALCGAFPMAFRETLPDLITVSGTTSQGARGGTAALGGRDSTRTPSHAGSAPFFAFDPKIRQILLLKSHSASWPGSAFPTLLSQLPPRPASGPILPVVVCHRLQRPTWTPGTSPPVCANTQEAPHPRATRHPEKRKGRAPKR